MSLSEYVSSGLTYTLIGAGIGGFIGIANTARKVYFPSKVQNADAFNAYSNIKLDSIAMEALDRLKSYKNLAPREYTSILENLNSLIGIQVAINEGNIQLNYSMRATGYVTKLQATLYAMKNKTRNVSVPSWDADEASIRQIADDYLYNISQDVNQYMLYSRTN
jgi:hypothetical protein